MLRVSFCGFLQPRILQLYIYYSQIHPFGAMQSELLILLLYKSKYSIGILSRLHYRSVLARNMCRIVSKFLGSSDRMFIQEKAATSLSCGSVLWEIKPVLQHAWLTLYRSTLFAIFW
jgi:hypothetical protein